MADTMLRHWTMLQLIPRAPRKISVQDLASRLNAQGYEVTERTIQRDLQKLSGSLFPLRSDERNRPYGWCWSEDASVMDIPGMDPQTALSFSLARRFLTPLMAPSTLEALQPHFDQAARVLSEAPAVVAGWPEKVHVQHRGQRLLAPEVPQEVLAVVYEALLRERQFRVDYQRRSDHGWHRRLVSPRAVVLREGVIYLLATLEDYDDVLHLVLHRMRNPELLDTPLTPLPGFSAGDYLEQQPLDFPEGPIQLRIRMAAEPAKHLAESPLSEDQRIEPDGDGWVQISARLLHTNQLGWWLLGFGEQVEVLEPAALRQWVADTLTQAAARYNG
ncbi:transcriptional regulator [Methylonatrum kenyense]|uniref:helix-turn-helix transcriptional regulator n=1 Tax=Methylonatrum kenyense TaxID=455253 RepID=UPI0020C0CE62|nr:transcriptional regulator [Methylonatrum kenyense]MCK8515012.1 transcriptional regulator [Methylonatrum kenyense]